MIKKYFLCLSLFVISSITYAYSWNLHFYKKEINHNTLVHTLEFEGELSDYFDEIQLEKLSKDYTVLGKERAGYIYLVKNEKTSEMIKLMEEHCQKRQIALDTLNLRAES